MNSLRVHLLLLVLLTTAVTADQNGPFLKRLDQFNRAVLRAQAFEDLYPYLSAGSVSTLKQLDPAECQQGLGLLKMMTTMEAGMEMQVTDSKIDAKQAMLTLKAEKKEDGGTSTVSRNAEFVKEGGKWKLVLGPPPRR